MGREKWARPSLRAPFILRAPLSQVLNTPGHIVVQVARHIVDVFDGCKIMTGEEQVAIWGKTVESAREDPGPAFGDREALLMRVCANLMNALQQRLSQEIGMGSFFQLMTVQVFATGLHDKRASGQENPFAPDDNQIRMFAPLVPGGADAARAVFEAAQKHRREFEFINNKIKWSQIDAMRAHN
jgi:hypothetical protein